MTNEEKNILNALQADFTLTGRPYFEIAKLLGMTEEKVLKTAKNLKKRGLIKYIGAIINTAALNYESALVAFWVSPDKIAKAVKIINSYPGVSHNYLRDSKEYNIWFTIAVPKDADLKRMVGQMASRCAADGSIFLPAIKTYKVRLMLDVGDAVKGDFRLKSPKNNAGRLLNGKLSAGQKRVLVSLQYGLPLASEPFKKLAGEIGMSQASILKISEELLEKGFIKRFGAIISPRKSGYKFNALVLWNAPSGKIDSLGKKLASFKNISHCYRRIAYPDWPYSIYTMVHAKGEKEFWALMENFIRRIKLKEFKILKTKKEFKKQRLVYFDRIK